MRSPSFLRLGALALVAALLPVTAVASFSTATAAGSAIAEPRGRSVADHASGGVSVRDIEIRVPDQAPVRAWLVAPAGPAPRHSMAGVLWLHWLGQIHNDRSEFLSQAVAMADRGVVSVLPDGGFPWVEDPDGTAADVTRVEDQLAAYRRVLDRLASRRAVDPERIAVVGHDYGAMYGSLLADSDERVSVLALQALDATWGNWFATYWLGLEGQARADYSQLFAGLEPVDHVARLGSHVLLQWAGRDEYVSAEVADAVSAANPDARRIDYPRADHQLDDKALRDLAGFLTEQLALPE